MVLPGFKGLPLREFLKRLWRSLQDDVALDGAAQLAYYFVYSLFPLLFFAVALTAFLPLRDALESTLAQARPFVPATTMQAIEGQLRALLERPRPQLLGLSLLVALWSASRGVDGYRKALNLAYRVTESRSFLKTQWLALWTTIVSAVLVLVGFAMILLGGDAGAWLAAKLGVAPEFAVVWSWLRWPATALVIMSVAALTYYALPDVKQAFRFITPGSVTSTVLWLLSTWGFSKYADNADSFNVTYGSLGGAIVLLTWLYLSALVFIIGGEMNAVIEHSSPTGKLPGARDFHAPASEAAQVTLPPGAAKSRGSAWRARLRRVLRRDPDRHPLH